MHCLRIQGLLLLTLYVVLDYNFEYIIRFNLHLHLCSFIWCFSKLWFSESKTFVSRSDFGEFQPQFNNWYILHPHVWLLLLVYAWFWKFVCWHVCPFFSQFFKKFSQFFCFLKFYTVQNLLLYIWPLIALLVYGTEIFFIVYIRLKETLFFNFSYKQSI